MIAQKIVTYPDPALNLPCAPVEVFDERLERLIANLFATLDTLDEGKGIGLSAPQIGINERVSVVRVPGDAYGPVAYVNPVVRSRAAFGLVQESCLSVPGIEGNVVRATKVGVEAFDAKGNRFSSEVDGMHAVCLLHEIDHLDGKLFIDRLFWFSRWRAKRKLRRFSETPGSAGRPTLPL
ncbi:MAG: peptide deformylase [Gammaproteobacteria bacterium]|nr:peptide deformylase [Gammaproteobacteria bacterium]